MLLRGRSPSAQGVGARVEATVCGRTQVRLVRAGSNFVSQDPAVAHFGLGAEARVQRLRITWPDGKETDARDVTAGRRALTQP